MTTRFLVTVPEKGDFFGSYEEAVAFAQQSAPQYPGVTVEVWVPVAAFALQEPQAEDAGVADPLKVAGVVTTPDELPQAAPEFDDGA